MNIKIRKATEQDARGITEVNTYTWLTTYKGIIPDDILENRLKTMEERIIKTAKAIKNKQDDFYVALIDNKIVGIMCYGKSRNKDYPDCGEIYAIYVLKEYQGYHIGTKLFLTGIKQLKNAGFNNMILNVLEGNPAIKFYEKFGGIKKGFQQELLSDFNLKENIMYFTNLEKIYNENLK